MFYCIFRKEMFKAPTLILNEAIFKIKIISKNQERLEKMYEVRQCTNVIENVQESKANKMILLSFRKQFSRKNY